MGSGVNSVNFSGMIVHTPTKMCAFEVGRCECAKCELCCECDVLFLGWDKCEIMCQEKLPQVSRGICLVGVCFCVIFLAELSWEM